MIDYMNDSSHVLGVSLAVLWLASLLAAIVHVRRLPFEGRVAEPISHVRRVR